MTAINWRILGRKQKMKGNQVIKRYQINGFTLVEMLISLLLGVIVMEGVLSSYSDSSAAYAELQKNSSRNEDGRYALNRIKNDLALAGFYGDFYDETWGGSVLCRTLVY